MTISFVTSGLSPTDDSSRTTMASAACNVTTGDHIVVYARWETADTTVTIADTAGNTYTALTGQHNINNGLKAFYCLNATGNAANVATATFGAARTFTRCEQIVFRATGTLTFTAADYGTHTAASTVANGTPFNATHPALVVAVRGAYNDLSTSSIVGSSGGSYTLVTSASNLVGSGYKITSANLTSETVTATMSGSSTGNMTVLQFAESGGGGGGGSGCFTVSFS